jgi:flagellar hook-basal body complex protein FliE
MKLSEITNTISNVGGSSSSSLVSSLNESNEGSLNNGNSGSFASMLKNSINELNDSQVQGYNSMEEIATGKVENLQEAIHKIEQAELSLKLGLEVKNKALGAYKQVMSMQI